MPRELILLVGREKTTVQRKRYNPFFGHWCTAGEMSQKVQELSPEEAKALTRIQEFVKHENVVYRVLSVSDFWVRLRFRLRRVERTPLVVCGKRIFWGVPSMSDLAALIR